MKWFWLGIVFILAGGLFATAQWVHGQAGHDWKTVERLIGYPGQAEGDGLKINVPRSDLNVLVHGSWIDPRAGLNSWFAFKSLPKGSLLRAEMVLVDWEVPRVEALLASYQLTLTAIYRPFNGENPGVACVDFTGKGPRVLLAQEVRALLGATSMPLTLIPSAANPPTPVQTAFSLPLEKILGPAQWLGGVLSFSYTPAEPVMNERVSIPSYMGYETVFYFQPEGKQANVYGQWVLSPVVARNVVESLMKNHIGMTGIHSELLDLSPSMVFIRFWAEGNPAKIAKALKEALAQTKLVGWTPGQTIQTEKP
jgi:hypothetical protein